MIPDDAWPAGDRIVWHDDETRTFYDFLNEEERPYTAEENAAADAAEAARAVGANREVLTERARSALVSNREFLAVASPTNAQTLAQVRALTRQMNSALRLILGDLSGTD